MSKLLTVILKTSLLPAACMIVSKLLGLYLAVSLYDIPLSIQNEVGDIFSVQLYVNARSDTLLANSISNIFMLGLMTLVSLYLTVKYTLYIKSQGNPRTIVKLTRLNLLKWITDGQTKFIKIFIWSLYLLATCAIVITSSLNAQTYIAVGATAFFISILTIWSLIRTFEFESAKIYPKDHHDYL